MWGLVSGRDFVHFVHWRLYTDGTFVIMAYSEAFDELRPPLPGLVRGDTTNAGWVLKPAKNGMGTEVYFLVEVRM